MFSTGNKTTNIYHQILQRERNTCDNPKAFGANLFRERLRVAKNLYKTDLRGHFGCVNAIEFSHGGKFLASGGDDKRVLVWDIEKSLAGISSPRALATEQTSNIFCLGFDSKNRKLISGGNDTLAIAHDLETGHLDNIFKHDGPVYGLSIDPQNDNVFSTASENGEILLFDQRSTDHTVVASVPSSFLALEFHPTIGNLLVTANSKRGATLYDTRKVKQPVMLYGNLENPRSCMSVRFNRTGKLILGLRRRLPPILYDVNSPDPICTFYHSNYYNSCTMKSCTFAGEDDEMVISGSDDFNLYVWRLSDIDLEDTEQWVESTQMVLYGHRSIVNQVRYNRQKCLLASSGVEKIIKIWSPFQQHNWNGSLTEEASCSDSARELYSPYNLFTMALPDNWHNLSHDYSSENTNEDPRMMAFFDSLIQQEIEEWESNSSTDVSQEENRSISSFFSCGSTSSSNSSSSDSVTTSSSSSSSSSDNDSDNANNSSLGKRRRRLKQQTAIRQKCQRKRHRKKNKLAKVKINQLQKPTNRIAYLIAKKRNTLRRLAIKGASLNDRLQSIVNGRKSSNNLRQNHRKRSVRRRQVQQARASNSLNNSEKPTTSAAAAAALLTTSRPKHKAQTRKYKLLSDSNESSEEDSGNFATSSSSPSNAANTSSSSNNNNLNVPSTSTGITSNFRDAFLRLSRQIFMSDSEDDDEAETGVQEKKRNSKNREANFENNNLPVKDLNTNSPRSLRSNQRPRNSAAINVINKNETILPQRHHPTSNESSKNNININDGYNVNVDYSKNQKDTECSRLNGSKSISSFGDTNCAVESSSNCRSSSCSLGKSHIKRRCIDAETLDDFPTTSSTRSFNNNNRSNQFEENITSTSTLNSSSLIKNVSPKSTKIHQHQSPLKKRKMSINDYINNRSNFNNGNLEKLLEEDEVECTNTETNNNDIFANEEEIVNYNGLLTPQRPSLIHREHSSLANYEHTTSSQPNNNNTYLFTPDSGVSLNNSTTPSTIDQNDIQISNSTTRIGTYLSTCYENDDCDVKNVDERRADNDEDEGVVVINNRRTNLNQFQQKVARVRRNYRKQFFDDTESD